MRNTLRNALSEAERLLASFQDDEAAMRTLEEIAAAVADVFSRGGKVLACGNGGSMADAMHFCEEWTGRFRADRPPYPALALSDPSHITCVANDYGFEQVFARQVEAFGSPGDLLLVLSTSGNSPNILAAARAAKKAGMLVVGMLGRGGGDALSLCDLALVAPGDTADRVQELHMLCLHAVIEAVEGALSRVRS